MHLELDYDRLVDLVTDLGYRLLQTGAEIYRVEESVQRLLQAYGVTTGEVFAIPNCLIVSLTTPGGQPITRVRRVGPHGTDIARLEAYNAFCRSVCSQPLPFDRFQARMDEIANSHLAFPTPVILLAHLVGGGAYSLFYGGTLSDGLCGGISCVAAGLCFMFMSKVGGSNQFIRTLVSGAALTLCALVLFQLGLCGNLDKVIIGALMVLVPGIIFTNAIRNVMAGDLTSGINKFVEALLIGVSIALGTGFVLGLSGLLM